MKQYDVIVIGSGAGASLVNASLIHGLSTALVERGPVGGTCLNLGCIPSKILIFPADRIMEIQEASKVGIRAEIKEIDFQGIMERMRNTVRQDRESMRRELNNVPELDFYEDQARFVDEYVLEVSGETIKGEKIFIASGARPLIPPIGGLEKTGYLTNESVLDLKKRPESVIIIGGGYIAAEYGHFFSAMGAQVSILQRGRRLLKSEEPEISSLLEEQMAKRMKVHTHTEVMEASAGGNICRVIAKDTDTGETRAFSAEKLLVAAGRKSNADLLKVEETGVQTDEKGYIIVDEYLETTKKDIFALGDAIGKQMFRHAANHEANLVLENAIHGENMKMNFRQVPHAVFSYPQIASVGLTEAAAKKLHEDVLVGIASYREVAKGQAMMETHGFAKAVVQEGTGNILGFHIIGPHASILIQEVINAMASDATVMPIVKGMHIHPALCELIQAAIGNLQEPDDERLDG
jgi:mycothione reductase